MGYMRSAKYHDWDNMKLAMMELGRRAGGWLGFWEPWGIDEVRRAKAT